ncbi:MAG: aminotransferase class I/II-fold pyridoxal phosphate-dependent enzyme [Bryobacterales bacterium]|nr:aminotransferase class I/II-fold pyridoxal phosphate-dependent enzyme [Bryobacterales bacterium]
MSSIDRRQFLAAGTATGFASAAAGAATKSPDPARDRQVNMTGDGVPLTPREWAALLDQVASREEFQLDSYSVGGPIETMERVFAEKLGKEAAIFFGAGTLANQIAVRHIAAKDTKVLVPRESHYYADSVDCGTVLSSLNLIPLGTDRATFTLDEVKQEVEWADSLRGHVPVGAIVIESPVRRKDGEIFDVAEMRKICDYARSKGIRTHLDGARMYLAAPYAGISAREFAEPFDTVYVSLHKYFNSACGAIVAGPKKLIEPMVDSRRMFGGALPKAWMFGAMTLHFFEGFEQRYQKAYETTEALWSKLAAHPKFRIERIPKGSNIVALHVNGDTKKLSANLAKQGVTISGGGAKTADGWNRILLRVNETAGRRSADELASLFTRAVESA